MNLSSPAPQKRFYFIGVTTGQSSIRKIFPLWSEALGLHAELIGVDLPLDLPPEDYRQVLTRIKDDPHAAGALVTSHKLGLFQSAPELFAHLDPYAQRLHEVACIVRRADGSLEGSAKDPTTSILSLRHIRPDDYWSRSGAHVLCIGVGGSGQAFAMGLLTHYAPQHLPERILLAARNQRRIDQARAALDTLPGSERIEYRIAATPEDTDTLLKELPPGSLIANATGMGKDVPGSPLTDAAIFPEKAIAWDFNYRGDLTFLTQAQRQSHSRGVEVHDGWLYFLYGWTHVMAEVFGFDLDRETFERLAQMAEPYRAR